MRLKNIKRIMRGKTVTAMSFSKTGGRDTKYEGVTDIFHVTRGDDEQKREVVIKTGTGDVTLSLKLFRHLFDDGEVALHWRDNDGNILPDTVIYYWGGLTVYEKRDMETHLTGCGLTTTKIVRRKDWRWPRRFTDESVITGVTWDDIHAAAIARLTLVDKKGRARYECFGAGRLCTLLYDGYFSECGETAAGEKTRKTYELELRI